MKFRVEWSCGDLNGVDFTDADSTDEAAMLVRQAQAMEKLTFDNGRMVCALPGRKVKVTRVTEDTRDPS